MSTRSSGRPSFSQYTYVSDEISTFSLFFNTDFADIYIFLMLILNIYYLEIMTLVLEKFQRIEKSN